MSHDPVRHGDPTEMVGKETTMAMTTPLLPTLTRTRRRFLGSAALTVFAAHLGMTGSARARTTTTSGSVPAREESMMTATAMLETATDIRPFRVNVPQAD